MKFYLLTLLALTLLDSVAIAQEPARNPYISQAAWEEIEPGRNFIYQVIGHSVAIIEEAENSEQGECYRVDAEIQHVGTRQYAFALIPDGSSGRMSWFAAGDDCGERSVPVDDLAQRWSIPIDEPQPDFVFQVIGESITQIIDVQYLDNADKYRVTTNVADTQLCILMLEARAEPRHEWTVGGVECATHADMQETIEKEGYLEIN